MTEATQPPFSTMLMCRLAAYEVDLSHHRTTLWLAAGNCCDMTGAIRFARRLDPKVRKIISMSGDIPDTTYERHGDSWGAHGPLSHATTTKPKRRTA